MCACACCERGDAENRSSNLDREREKIFAISQILITINSSPAPNRAEELHLLLICNNLRDRNWILPLRLSLYFATSSLQNGRAGKFRFIFESSIDPAITD